MQMLQKLHLQVDQWHSQHVYFTNCTLMTSDKLYDLATSMIHRIYFGGSL